MAELKITKNNFEKEVINSDIPVMLDFWADWCGPCRMLAPVLKEIADESEGKIKVCKINVDEESELAAAFSIASIPTVIIIKEGKVTEKSIGYKSKEALLALI